MTAKNNAYKKASNQADKAQKTYDSYSSKKNQLTSQISKLRNNISSFGSAYKYAMMNLAAYSSSYNQALSQESTGRVSA